MSRALDASVKKALKYGNHKEVFEQIAAVLSDNHDGYLEIEVLPTSHRLDEDVYVLQDGEHIGVHKLRLVQAFLHARQIFNKSLLHDKSIHNKTVEGATAVILLMDSEHLTAANARKRLLASGFASDAERREKLMHELFIMNSFLRSRLYRHTKSPVLWNHKRWLLRQQKQAGIPINLRHEFDRVICVAAERHPRNYYAWTYARDVIASAHTTQERDGQVAEQILPVIEKWCRLHHQDISGWSFLLHLVLLFPSKAPEVFDNTLSLAEMFKWRNESVWHFLKNMALMLARKTDAAREKRFLDVWTALRRDVGNDGNPDAKVLDRVTDWIGLQTKSPMY
ncbi:hypothetical protein QQS21_011310 [Conoideocrella luteorostrata]|uniref:Protein prenyltransferase n=1 Tax=Conoideocrella luteorostrata TaxID=1105319 RepID=A0AAJ0FNN9_9HYPO|nr:hypothetical protein QQS21_011310 [Conoideocrella luteorostrata]